VRRGLISSLGLFGALVALALVPVASQAGPASVAKAKHCDVPGYHKPLYKLWKPHVNDALRYARTRAGDIAFSVRTTQNKFYPAHRPDHQEWSASIVKAMLLVSYISEPSVAHRKLTASERSTLSGMIEASNNTDAQDIYNQVGNAGLEALAHRVGMTHFATNPQGIWGETLITARDQTKFFLHIDKYMPSSHRVFGMYLLNHIIPSERWGIGQVNHHGWRLYFKGGWGYGTGLIDSQVAMLKRGCARVSLAVLTMHDYSQDYGNATLYGIFSRLLKGFPRGKK
jgi:hypothetical protein